MSKEIKNSIPSSFNSLHPVVNTELMKSYSELIQSLDFHVVPAMNFLSLQRVAPLIWEAKISNVYSFYQQDVERPFLSGAFETEVLVTCHEDFDIAGIHAKEIYLPETIKVLRQHKPFKQLVQSYNNSENAVFFELVNTLKHAQNGVEMRVHSSAGLVAFDWKDYMNALPITIEDLFRAG